MKSFFNFFFFLIDILLKFIVELTFFLFLPLSKLFFLKKRFKEDTICLFKRYHDTIERHNQIQTKDYLKRVFKRSLFKKVIVLCVGNGKKDICKWRIMGHGM